MNRVNEKFVGDIIRDKRVIIVCSAPSCLENTGSFIDGHDLVVRVNNYKTKGIKNGTHFDFTPKVGTRTDIHYSFYGTSIKTDRNQLIKEGVKLCMCKCPDSKPIHSPWHEQRGKQRGIDFRWIYLQRQSYFPCPVFIPDDRRFLKWFDLLKKHVPTTGFSCVMDVLSFEPKSVHLTGFDGFSSGKHNVNETWTAKNMDDPIRHMPNLELNVIRDLYKQKKITVDNRLKSIL